MADSAVNTYTDANIRTLEGVEHIRMRPGMYIGRLGNGNNPGDGIYVLLKEIIDNSVDEFAMGFGKQVQITIEEKTVTVRDFGAFVEILPGVEGLLHISEMADYRVNKVTDICSEGDLVTVKVIDIDSASGKVRLSRKAALKELGD